MRILAERWSGLVLSFLAVTAVASLFGSAPASAQDQDVLIDGDYVLDDVDVGSVVDRAESIEDKMATAETPWAVDFTAEGCNADGCTLRLTDGWTGTPDSLTVARAADGTYRGTWVADPCTAEFEITVSGGTAFGKTVGSCYGGSVTGDWSAPLPNSAVTTSTEQGEAQPTAVAGEAGDDDGSGDSSIDPPTGSSSGAAVPIVGALAGLVLLGGGAMAVRNRRAQRPAGFPASGQPSVRSVADIGRQTVTMDGPALATSVRAMADGRPRIRIVLGGPSLDGPTDHEGAQHG